jgi:hypothetical protein
MKAQNHWLPNLPLVECDYTEEDLSPIKDEIFQMINDNFEGLTPYNSKLAGNLKKEFRLQKSAKQIEDLLLPICKEYLQTTGMDHHIKLNTKNCKLTLDEPWVNFQQQNEFNPMHDHSGVLSYVIWIKVPYTMDQQMGFSPGFLSNHNVAGTFEFAYTDVLGHILTYTVPADEKYENCGFIFPASLKHQVYPFFGVDGYRISVSGNFLFDVDNSC